MRSSILLPLCAVLLCLSHAPCRAEGSAPRSGGPVSGPFQEVPAQDAAYAQVRSLQPLLFTGFPESAFDGKRALTRFEFAVALQRMCQEPERLVAAVSRPSKPRLKSGPATRPDSPWKPAPTPVAENPLRVLAPLVQEFSPELKMLGADVDRAQANIDACLRRGLVPRPRETAVAAWEAVCRLKDLPTPQARAERAVSLLREEIAHPNPDPRYLAGPEENSNLLDFIVDTAAESHAEAGIVLEAWRAAEPGRLRDCLAVLLGRLGVAHVWEDLRVCAADAEMPQPLRVMAVQALRNATSAADIQLLVRLTQSDGAAFRDFEHRAGCMSHGPEGWHYPVRRAARDVLARLTPADSSTRALVKHSVEQAILFQKLAPSER